MINSSYQVLFDAKSGKLTSKLNLFFTPASIAYFSFRIIVLRVCFGLISQIKTYTQSENIYMTFIRFLK